MIVKVDTRRNPKRFKIHGKPRPIGTNHYKVREASLKTLGFATYKKYLASDLWAEIRTRIMAKCDGKCFSCGNDAYTAHHVTYSVAVLAGKEDSQLIAVCRECHKAIEFKGEHKRIDATSVHTALGRVTRGIGKRKGKQTKVKDWRKSQPMCRCCRQNKMKPLGRDGICLSCYKKYRSNVHNVARQQDEKALLKESPTPARTA